MIEYSGEHRLIFWCFKILVTVHLITGCRSSTVETVAQSEDSPNIILILAVTVPEKIDGISFLPTLLGDSLGQEQHQYLYREFYEQGGRQAVLKDNFKAIKLNVRTGTPDPVELYNLSVDISESNNIAGEHPDLVQEMERLMSKSHRPIDEISLFEP